MPQKRSDRGSQLHLPGARARFGRPSSKREAQMRSSHPRNRHRISGIRLFAFATPTLGSGSPNSVLDICAQVARRTLPYRRRGVVHHSKFDPLMTGSGQKRTSPVHQAMSALPPKADIGRHDRHVRFVPIATTIHAPRQNGLTRSPHRRGPGAATEWSVRVPWRS